jgi:hypothetical protein
MHQELHCSFVTNGADAPKKKSPHHTKIVRCCCAFTGQLDEKTAGSC